MMHVLMKSLMLSEFIGKHMCVMYDIDIEARWTHQNQEHTDADKEGFNLSANKWRLRLLRIIAIQEHYERIECLAGAGVHLFTFSVIVSFLQQNAHPLVADRVPSVLRNVMNQIRLWKLDLNRVHMTTAHFFNDFPSRDLFEAACDFAREYSRLLWKDSKKMCLIVKTEIHALMRDFVSHQK
ncbi:hypothetical protein E3N88_31485 [Mikania micrantha]|uniref:Transcription factor Tfb2 C-terminal domain-containing protein n=1 Tax=Mikania micrantha TaxID=192012 RepID=A0A5N6MPJ7_9ASTR|nr:hypothetical protein E3N88_31485 [Mikania micrantha]